MYAPIVSAYSALNSRLQAIQDRHSRNAVLREIARVERTPRKPAPNRNLVMGLATNYSTRELGAFVRSLRATGYDGDVVLWVLDVDPATAAFLSANRVRQESFRAGQRLPMTPHLARFFCFYRFLRALDRDGAPYGKVFLTDVRDVVFQANPFDIAMPNEVLVFLEDSAQTLGSCTCNAGWVRQAFGEQALSQIGGQRISCSGTVLGTWTGILNYLLMMQLCTYECAPPARRVTGIDQAIHNNLLHTGRLDRVAIMENAEHVWTLHHVPGADIFVTPQQRVADRGGRVFPVIHQYDRHPILNRLVTERFGDAQSSASS